MIHQVLNLTSEGLVKSQFFSITSVEYTILNNKKYKKTNVVFNCDLSDDKGNTINVTEGKGILFFGAD